MKLAKTLRQIQNTHGALVKLVVLSLAIFGGLVACKSPDTVSPTINSATTETRCGTNGYLQANFGGSIETAIDWSDHDLSCDSMLRPNGEGVRLRFSGNIANEWLAIIIAMPDLARGEVGKELPSNITVTVEGSGRFFSTPNPGSCWTDISEQERLPDDSEHYTLKGNLYCVAPLGELNGNAAVSISELSFSSIVDWSTK